MWWKAILSNEISVIFSGYTGASLLWGKHVLKRGVENSSGSPYQRLMTTYHIHGLMTTYGNNVEIDSSYMLSMSSRSCLLEAPYKSCSHAQLTSTARKQSVFLVITWTEVHTYIYIYTVVSQRKLIHWWSTLQRREYTCSFTHASMKSAHINVAAHKLMKREGPPTFVAHHECM